MLNALTQSVKLNCCMWGEICRCEPIWCRQHADYSVLFLVQVGLFDANPEFLFYHKTVTVAQSAVNAIIVTLITKKIQCPCLNNSVHVVHSKDTNIHTSLKHII